MYVCSLCIYIYIYIFVYTYIYIYMCVVVCMYVHMHAYIGVSHLRFLSSAGSGPCSRSDRFAQGGIHSSFDTTGFRA